MPLLQFLNEGLELPQLLAIAVPTEGRARRYPVHLVLYAFLVGSLLGVAKLAHLEWLRGDAVVEKFIRLPAWPVRKVFSQALEHVSAAGVIALTGLLSNFGLRSLAGRSSVVLDFDSTALRCFGLQEKAAFGYCGKGRNRRRHHPLVGSVAETRAVINAKYRDGWFVSHLFRANEVACLLRLLAWNADLLFQRDAERRAHQEGRRVVRMGVQARQQYLYRQAGRLLRANNRWELRLAANRGAADIWAFYGTPGTSSA